MNTKKIFYLWITLLLIILGFESCSKDEMYSETIDNSPVLDKIPMAFNSNKPTYDNGLSRSFDDTENQWYIGDTLYVELQPEYGKHVLVLVLAQFVLSIGTISLNNCK